MSMYKLTLLCLPLLLAGAAIAQVSGGISITDDGVKSFYLAIGRNYNVRPQQVTFVHERRIPDEELPVVFFIARRAHVRPEEVADLRLSGRSWMDITIYYHLRPSIYYVRLNGDPGPDYRRAYSHWRQPKRQWNNARLEDDDIIKMVNLQFISKRYSVKPDEVVRLRGEQGNFVNVTREISRPDYRSRRAEAERQKKNDNRNNRGRGTGYEENNGRGNHRGNGDGK